MRMQKENVLIFVNYFSLIYYINLCLIDALKFGKENVHSTEVPLSPNLNDKKMYRGIVSLAVFK